MSRVLDFTVGGEFDGKKLNTFLRSGARLSHSLVSTLRHTEGSFTRNGSYMRTVDVVHEGDVITVTFPDGKCSVEPVEIPFEIIYEDEDLLIINKGSDIAIHPSHGHQTDTLANGVAWHLINKGHSGAFMAVGRLDKGTSGIVVCALSTYCASLLSGNIEKTYIALCDGTLSGSGTVDAPIFRPDPDKTLRACREGAAASEGERAVTHYEALELSGGMTLLRLRLETGRTHQIRVHMAHIGAPLVGDSLYGTARKDTCHHMLHCAEVRFVHPVTKRQMIFSAPLPEEFKRIFLSDENI